ncbi:MAG: type IV-A pilus assembly ATPase PilB [Acidobacteria bacterium]|nr:type IV-A pilus assembly ATPase PilB [Acidobacteriota bacterium]
MTTKIGDLLLREKMISAEQLNKALEHQKKYGGKIGSILVEMQFITEDDITSVLSRQYGVPSINLDYFEVDADVVKLIPLETAQKYQVLPLSRVGNTLTIATTDPSNVFAMDDIKFMTGFNIEPVIASEGGIMRSIEKYYGTPHSIELKKVFDDLSIEKKKDEFDLELEEEQEQLDVDELQKSSEEAPIIRLVNLIMLDAIKKGASDIHIEAFEKELRVRMRIDGILYAIMSPPLKLKDALTSRIKIMSKMDIAEKRLPQDGRIKIKTTLDNKKLEIDFRVSCLPCIFGEKIVLRLLDKTKLMLDMTKLGMEPSTLASFETAICKPYGMVLVTGPTGSGKTNTLYSAVSRLNQVDVNIMTAEDPVEFNIVGVNQCQTHEAIGLTFAAALRSFLRQDPNIVLVGEIRDFETAEIAIKAALTGHLVLSTLHTNDAPSTVNRLLNMGIEPFLVSNSLLLIAAQRLIRRICNNCKVEDKIPKKTLIDIGFSPDEANSVVTYRGQGCDICNNTGYKGRLGLFEAMSISEEISELILIGASARELKRKAMEEGMITLRRSGLLKIKEGITTVEEVLRETVKD